MLVSSEDKYDKTTSAEAFAIIFIVLIVVGSCVACSVCVFMSRRKQSMLIEENEKKRQAQLANTAPVVHAPPVQPVVQPGYVQPQVVQGGYGQPQPYPPPTGQVVGSYPPQGYAPQAPMATGTVVQGGYAPEQGYKPEGY